MTLIEGEVVIRPKKEEKLSLRQMVKRITRKNLHAETDWGRPAGKEDR